MNEPPSPLFHNAFTGTATTVADTPRNDADADCCDHPPFNQNHWRNPTTALSDVAIPIDGVTNVNDDNAI